MRRATSRLSSEAPSTKAAGWSTEARSRATSSSPAYPQGNVFGADGPKAGGDFGGGNILSPAPATTVITGGNGDDILDGDAFLHVELLPNDQGEVGPTAKFCAKSAITPRPAMSTPRCSTAISPSTRSPGRIPWASSRCPTILPAASPEAVVAAAVARWSSAWTALTASAISSGCNLRIRP